MIIQTLSQYQIGWLEAIFQYAYAPFPHNINVEKIGIGENGVMIVEYKKLDQMIVKTIPRDRPEKAKEELLKSL
jgi:hypothetical protein